MKITKIKEIIKNNNLRNISNLLIFLKNNWNLYEEEELREVAEYSNANRQKNAAYYTDDFIVQELVNALPILDKQTISILEPSVGTGNFIMPLIYRLHDKFKRIDITVNDIDPDSIKLTKFFLERQEIPDNVRFHFTNFDYLSDFVFYDKKFDYIIGNPPFQRISLSEAKEYGDSEIRNIAGFFMRKSLCISHVTCLVMPKSFLSIKDFKKNRDDVGSKRITQISDFGEKGFKGVLIETIGIVVENKKPNKTRIHSFIDKSDTIVNQDYVIDPSFPTWLIYRNTVFDNIAKDMEFNIFTVFRDRQLTNSNMSNRGDIRVIKSRNISFDGSKIIDIPGYDRYISYNSLKKLSVIKYIDRDDVYLVPNMTYYPRMIRKMKGVVTNGSVAILKLKEKKSINEKQIKFFSSPLFRYFYKIARNKGTRSLNIDSVSVFWFGKYHGKGEINDVE